jgi:hypothetical protein
MRREERDDDKTLFGLITRLCLISLIISLVSEAKDAGSIDFYGFLRVFLPAAVVSGSEGKC